MQMRRRLSVLSWEAGRAVTVRAEGAMGGAAEIEAQCSRRDAGCGRVQCAAASSRVGRSPGPVWGECSMIRVLQDAPTQLARAHSWPKLHHEKSLTE
jgi:hypothetical protein